MPGAEDLALTIITSIAEKRETKSKSELAEYSKVYSKQEVESPAIIGTLDRDWRITRLSSDAIELLGTRPSDLVGSGFVSWLHPGDLGNVLVGVGNAFNAEASVTLRARLRHVDGTWLPVSMVVVPLVGSDAPEFAFVARSLPGLPNAAAFAAPADRIALLEQRLWRIALEVQAAGIVQGLRRMPDLHRLPQIGELSGRQLEVLSHLLDGQRVPAIAASMYVSQSTVRNHLSAIYHKLGVHSQSELVALVRDLDDPKGQM